MTPRSLIAAALAFAAWLGFALGSAYAQATDGTPPLIGQGHLFQRPTITNAPAAADAAAVPPARVGAGQSPQRRAADEPAPAGDGRTQDSATAGARPTPPPSNEFQRFVLAATGQSLPLFGESYFTGGATTFAPIDRVPVPADYVLGPGDELYVRGWGNVDIDLRATIDRNGQINIPRVGTFTVAGLKASEVEGHLQTHIGRVYRGFSLNVTLGQLRSIQVFVVGHARQPGSYTVGSLSTLVNAVFASGGPGVNGSMRRVILRRGSTVVTELDLYDFIVQGNKAKDARLLPGDVIVYLPAGPRVAVLGAVDTPGIYELRPEGGQLAEVVALAGAGRVHANLQMAHLESIDPANTRAPRQVAIVSLVTGGSTPLRDGDMLTVGPIPPQFANAVTLRGNVAVPLRYPYSPGMRISQLIPEREALITRDYYLRKNRLVQYLDANREIRAEGELPQMTPMQSRSGEPIQRGTAQPASSSGAPLRSGLGLADTEQTVRHLVDEPNWEYATIERLDTDRITTRLLPFNLGKAVLEKDPAHDLLLQPGDIVTVFGSKDIRGPQARGSRLVKVEGEVDRPGVYQLQPGETLRAVLSRAGGITAQAYLFGTDFSRESTRAKQRQAFQDALRRLETSAASAGATQTANLASTDAASATRLLAADAEIRRAQLDRLRALQPNGRIALELQPEIRTIDELPDLPLEDGDAILIPSRPGFVLVVGAVSNENAQIWRSGRTVENYLTVAGITQDADESAIFVVRADGSIVQRRGNGSVFGGGLYALELAPGDTLVVPDRQNRETAWNAFVRGLKDWTQILANFGLAAAAISVLQQ